MKRLLLLLSAFAVSMFASGCGQSGPLYLPGNPSQIEPPAEEPAALPSEPEDEEDKPDQEDAQ